MRDETGLAIGAAKIARDITEHKPPETSPCNANSRRDEFLAMLGHELRNPLAPIANGVFLLRRLAAGHADIERLCDIFDRQVGTMRRLLDDLLDASRLTQGKLRLTKEPVDFVASVQSAVESCRPLLQQRQQRFTCSIPNGPLYVLGDATRLAQAVSHLLTNASKYTPSDGEIQLEVLVRDRQIELVLRDSGVGLEAELLPRIFDLFVQAEPTLPRSQGGLGVGLSLVKGIAEAHGGSVQARSAGLNKGSEFVMRLAPLIAERAG